MNALIDDCLTPALLGLADWSLRWGVVIAVLAAILAVWRPRRVATRLLLCRLVLLGGLGLPLVPRCWGPAWEAAPPPEAVPVQARSAAGDEAPPLPESAITAP